MRNESRTLLLAAGVGGVGFVSGTTAPGLAESVAGAVTAVVGASVTLAAMLPLLLVPVRMPARAIGVRQAGPIRVRRRAPAVAGRGSARAAAVKRHTSMICC
jgi:hypothetical protein